MTELRAEDIAEKIAKEKFEDFLRMSIKSRINEERCEEGYGRKILSDFGILMGRAIAPNIMMRDIDEKRGLGGVDGMLNHMANDATISHFTYRFFVDRNSDFAIDELIELYPSKKEDVINVIVDSLSVLKPSFLNYIKQVAKQCDEKGKGAEIVKENEFRTNYLVWVVIISAAVVFIAIICS